MPKRDPDLLLEDMLVAMRKIERYTAGMDQDSFLQDEKTLDAVARNLEILGEASKQLPETSWPNIRVYPGARLRDCAIVSFTNTSGWTSNLSGEWYNTTYHS